MSATQGKLCGFCRKPYPGLGKYHPACRKPAYAAAKAAKESEIYKGAKKVGRKTESKKKENRRERLTNYTLSPEQQALKDQQRALNEEVDKRHSQKLETKVYAPGTPEFNELAAMYMRREMQRTTR